MSLKTIRNLLCLLLVLAIVILFGRYLIFQKLFLFLDIGSDTMALFYPSYLEEVRTIRSGQVPMWSFSKGIGQGQFTSNILSPFTWIRVLLGEQYLAYGIGWIQMLKVFLIAFVVFKLFRFQGLSWEASFLGSVLLSFSGYVVIGSCWYGHSMRIMLMLLVLLGVEMWLSKRKWWLIPFPLIFLAGPSLLFAFELVIIYLVLRLSLSSSLNFKSIGKLLKDCWKPLVTGILFMAPFLGFRIYQLVYSPRVGGAASYIDSLSSVGIFSFNDAPHYMTILARFFSNDLSGTGDSFIGYGNYLEAPLFYCGLASLLLVPQLFFHLRKKQKIVFAGLLGFWALILVFPYFRYALYAFAGDYYKTAVSLFIPFTLIWIASLTFDRLIKGARVNLPVLGITGAALIGLLFYLPHIFVHIPIDRGLRWTLITFIALEMLALGASNFIAKKQIFWLFFVVLVLVEGLIQSYPAINKRKALGNETYKQRTFYNDYSVEAIKYLKSIDSSFFRIQKLNGSYLSGLNDSQAQGYYDTKSYRSHNHNNYIQFYLAMEMMEGRTEHASRWIEGLNRAPELHPFFQIKYMITDAKEKKKMPVDYYENLGDLNGLTLYKNKTPIPFGFFVESMITESEFKGLETYYKRLNSIYKSVVIPDDEVGKYPALKRRNLQSIASSLSLPSYSKKLADRSFQIKSFAQNRIEGHVNLDKAAMLIFSMPNDAGWKAYVNGEQKDLSYVDNGLTGLYLGSSGEFEILLKYRPPFLMLGLIFLLLGIALYVYLLRRKKVLHAFIGNNDLKELVIEIADQKESSPAPVPQVKKKKKPKK